MTGITIYFFLAQSKIAVKRNNDTYFFDDKTPRTTFQNINKQTSSSNSVANETHRTSAAMYYEDPSHTLHMTCTRLQNHKEMCVDTNHIVMFYILWRTNYRFFESVYNFSSKDVKRISVCSENAMDRISNTGSNINNNFAMSVYNVLEIHGCVLFNGVNRSSKSVAIVTALQHSKHHELMQFNEYKMIYSKTLSNIWMYCEAHNYSLHLLNNDMFKSNRKSSWVKIELFRYYFKYYEWVMYTDIDAIFMDISKPLPIPDKGSMLVSTECLKNMNWKHMSGTMMLKNSSWSIAFLNKWDSLYENYKNVINHDQIAFQKLVTKSSDEIQISQSFMTYDMCSKNGHVMHFPGPNKPNRLLKAISRYKIKFDSKLILFNDTYLYQVPNHFGIKFEPFLLFEKTSSERYRLRKSYMPRGYFVACATKTTNVENINHGDIILLDCPLNFEISDAFELKLFDFILKSHALDIKITVGIPCIYEDKFIVLETLKSISEQLSPASEIVLYVSNIHKSEVQDFRLKCLKQLNNISFALLWSSERIVPGRARNEIAASAKYEWISFIDSDDIMHPLRLLITRRLLSINRNLKLLLHGYSLKILPVNLNDKIPVVFGECIIAKISSNTWNDGRHLTRTSNFTVHNGHPTIQTNLIKQNPQTLRPKGQDQIFLKDIVQNSIDSPDQLLFIDLPLTFWRERSKRLKIKR